MEVITWDDMTQYYSIWKAEPGKESPDVLLRAVSFVPWQININ